MIIHAQNVYIGEKPKKKKSLLAKNLSEDDDEDDGKVVKKLSTIAEILRTKGKAGSSHLGGV